MCCVSLVFVCFSFPKSSQSRINLPLVNDAAQVQALLPRTSATTSCHSPRFVFKSLSDGGFGAAQTILSPLFCVHVIVEGRN